MPTVAEQLRAAREARKISIEQVAEITKIRTDHLRALEEGNYEVFSAPVYIRGFVRTYSTLVKLDVPQMMAALEAELGQTAKFGVAPPHSDRPRGILDFVTLQFAKVDPRTGLKALVVIVLAVLALVIFFSWRNSRAEDPLRNLKPGVYQGTQHLSGETLPLPTAPR